MNRVLVNLRVGSLLSVANLTRQDWLDFLPEIGIVTRTTSDQPEPTRRVLFFAPGDRGRCRSGPATMCNAREGL